MLEQAIAIAAKAHTGQKDKVGRPYILHPLRVMFRCQSDDAKIVAILHDVVEDTAVTVAELQNVGFGQDILDALDGVTKREGESYDDFVERAAKNPISREVKLADLEDNMDVRRLPTIGEKDAKRLDKYVKAWRRLTGEVAS